MKILGCCIAKNENLYIKEWLDWHLNLGFSQIVIYDNNDDESLLNYVTEYINDNKVIVKNYRQLKAAQSQAYTSCYQEYNKIYDYIMFFDCDEYIQIDNTKFTNINEVIQQNKFKNADVIRLCWKVYGDSNLTSVINNNYHVQSRFTIPSKYLNYNHYYKSLIKCKNINIKQINAHGCYSKVLNAYFTNGIKCKNNSSSELETIYDDIWINHYHTKTIEEFIDQKFNRGDASSIVTANNTTIKFFFIINEYTQDKQQIINKKLFK